MNSHTRNPLGHRQLDRLACCQARLCELVELKDFPLHAIAALRELIPADLGCHAELDVQALHAIQVSDRDEQITPTLRESWSAHVLAPEFLQRWTASPELVPVRLSDLFGAELEQLPLYRDYLQRLDLHHQLAFGFRAELDLRVIVSLHRARGEFTDQELQLLGDVAPFVAVARRNAQLHDAALRECRIADLQLNWMSMALVPITPCGHVGVLSTSARRWMVDFFGGLPPHSGRLPHPIQSWLSHHVEERQHTGWRLPRSLKRRRDDTEVIVRLVGTPKSGLGLIFQHKQPILSSTIAAMLSIGPREVEVLRWRLANKNRNETATILGIKPGTVKTHIQNLYAKLGLEPEDGSSVAAANIVLDRLSRLPRGGGSDPHEGMSAAARRPRSPARSRSAQPLIV